MFSNPQTRRMASLMVLAATSVLTLAAPVSAYTWGYSPYTGGANWLWAARTLAYPLNRYSGYNAPFYLANSLLWSGSYAISQGLQRRRQTSGQYYDPEPMYYPRRRNRTVTDSPYVVDQVAQAQMIDDGVPQVAPPSGPIASPPLIDPAPLVQPQQLSPSEVAAGTPSLSPVTTVPPTPAPQLAPASGDPQPAAGQPGSPLAAGFIELINGSYGGDVTRALSDAQIRSYAHAVGLIDDSKKSKFAVSSERLELIKQILADKREDPLTRINAVRLLLKH